MSEGNIPVGFTRDYLLMLDVDLNVGERVVKWAGEYGKKWRLGSTLIMLSSDSAQLDFERNKLYNFFIIFGQPMPWTEVMFHLKNAYEDKIINKSFFAIRYYRRSITLRVTKKNKRKSHPKVFKYIPNGNNEGVMEFLGYWIENRLLG